MTPNAWDAAAASYEETIEKTTGAFVAQYLDHVAPTKGTRVADIACGAGVLTMAFAQCGADVVASDLSEAMVERVRARALEAGLADRITATVGDAEELSLDDSSVDAAVSNFGIIFCPRVDRALGEMARVTRDGGALMFSAWTSEARSGWQGLLTPDHEDQLGFELPPRVVFHWSSPDEVAAACTAAGWSDVTVEAIDAPATRVASWQEFGSVLDSPGTRANLAALTDDQRAVLRDYLVRRAHEVFGEAEVTLQREAWLIRGRKKC